ncbi:hypothetical protein [Micromonospora tulbaghiae]|uniref:hypothetical protein n=1 Tax=Micromonospora tulbaghiae TaxID=479978 RepID=UPI0013C4F831|nr:hypothetical protein [Micromonospora tulbaghiae]
MRNTTGKVRITRRPNGAEVAGVAESRRTPLAGMRLPHRLDPAVASRLAGARAHHACGLDYVARLGVYQEQNGPPYTLTARQRRRLNHKAGHQETQARIAILRRAELPRAGVVDARYVDDPWQGGASDAR